MTMLLEVQEEAPKEEDDEEKIEEVKDEEETKEKKKKKVLPLSLCVSLFCVLLLWVWVCLQPSCQHSWQDLCS